MRHVALLIETSRQFGRGLLRGIARYNQENGRWLTYCRPQGMGDMSPGWVSRLRSDGVLARITDRRMAAALARLKVPIVNLRGKMAHLPFPYVGVDNRAIARVAFEHLFDRGFRRFGFCGYRRRFSVAWDQRCDTFVDLVRQAGCTVDVCVASEPSLGPSNRHTWKRELATIARWVRGLPKPLAIMACTDDRGFQVLEACREAGIAVPEEVAVIGVANDDCLCALSVPPLTSVDVADEQIGYRAAALLDELMNGGRNPGQVLVEPRGVICRHSTDTMAVSDQAVAEAIRFIRSHACEQIHIDDVANHVHMTRSVLARRLKQALGRTIHDEIQRTRIARVQEMLTETNLPLKQVAGHAGFSSVQYMTRAFRALTGQTPAAYRRENRI
ncbi:MAG TPA: DNA-binding transcriptional regulator [Phycisphaerae bacterium]|nr:DNA-binding transcriptional regulator [Phycisphaerae bacterium]HOJ74152.1 DNA-binding transcriptional regulator [Phycisphaerae bacterium]HOM50746.1 DNA-binding transcriptional regulator [Phycisphaerae bacterium]HON64882.1 DNA-binding transcriptional regulator [Phycisphaerae bacterium]HOQ84669.1 DNA-binding transcriptional regulator [Phycisphaerae bacterium]